MTEGTSSTNLSVSGRLDEFLGNADPNGTGMQGPFRASAASVAAQIAGGIALEATPLGVETKSLSTPPVSPVTGNRYVVAAAPTGAWAGHANDIATWGGSAWSFITPSAGYVVNVLDLGQLYYYNGTSGAWTAFFADTLFFATWAALSAVTGTKAGQAAQVFDDASTHTDPVVGGTVDNEGLYSWSTSPAGWRRVADNSVTNMAPLSSPAFTDAPTTTVPPREDYSTRIPTTSSVADEAGAEIRSVTNNILRSEELDNAIWNKSGVTVSANSAVGPDGASSLDKVQEDSSTGAHTIFRAIAAVAVGTRVTVSWHVRAAELDKFVMAAVNGSVAYQARFDLTNKTATPTTLTVNLVAEIHEVSSGLFRCSISYVVTDGAAANTYSLTLVNVSNATSYAGTPGNGIHAGYAQVEYSPVLRPYVKTTSGAASKSFALRKPYVRRYLANTNGFGCDDDSNICYIVAIGGQSNGDGQGTDSLVATSALYSGNALMLAGSTYGPHAKGQRAAAFTDLIEVTAGASKETACSGLVSGMISRVQSEVGKTIRVLAFAHALGGTAYEQLKRGGIGSLDFRSYQWFLTALEDAAETARANGWRPVFLIHNWMGNEVNQNTPAEQWATFMCQNYRMMDEDIRRITGQTENWVSFIDQVSYVGNAANASAFAPTIVEGNRLAALRNSRIKLGNPTYQLERSAASNAIHFSCVGQNRRGQALARAVCAEMFGTGYEPFAMRKAYRSAAAEITVEFAGSMAGSLVMDTSDAIVTSTGLPSGNYYGFRFDDRSGASPSITGHSISGRSLLLTLSATPSANHAWRLAYATERNPSVITDGPATGARGCLRLDTAHTMLYSLSDDYDWCHPGILEVAK
ncbi:MAG: DUF2793 domain-containing protein [Dechloromonas sp.]|nr:DUF2793 domain-containing protein [Dechloromonas sp.]